METVALKEFIQSVPTCVETDRLSIVWQRLGEMRCDQAIVLDDRQAPLGLLRLSRLIPHLSLSHGMTGGDPTIEQIRQAGQDQQPLLEEVMPLSLRWTLEDFRVHLPGLERRQWALVDGAGRYVGMLDRLRLLQAIAHQPEPVRSGSKQLSKQPSRQPSKQPSKQPSNQRHAALQIPQGSAEPQPLSPMVELLERLPIPLMLQTASGRMVAQNLAWRQQISELRDPERISQEAGQILEEATIGSRVTGNTPDIYSSVWNSDLVDGAGRSLAGISKSAMGACLGTEPDTCVCICPMKNGQERVWQFVKIPMGSASAFKLATLEFSAEVNGHFAAEAPTDSLWLILAQDTTDQQQIVKELAAKNADLVQLNRLKDEFLSCISHELKTPLTAVLGLSSLLKDQALGKLNDRQSRYAQLIHRSGRHLISIVNNILDLTRIETGQMDLTPSPMRIEAVCQQAYQLARQMQAAEEEVETETLVGAAEGETRFNLDIQPGLETLVADELRLRQMLANLLSNALKFTAADAEIGLRVEAWEGWVAFTVWDQGIGIPSDKQHLIFQKFQQLENPLTRQFKGTGLGLVLTQRLARLHGGDVTFTSIEGQGSEFTLLLPPSPPAPTGVGQLLGTTHQPMEFGAASTTVNNRLVMIVEATPHLLDDLTHQLVALGYRVAIARSGTEALEKTRRLQPCVVFLNPVLPLLSGWDVLTLLKSDEETQQIPIVATATRIDKKQAYQNGADSFLCLPVQPDSLRRCLEQVVQPLHSQLPEVQLSLTVLHLSESQADPSNWLMSADLTSLLHPHKCRVLEVDDLDQADLLARVWKPDVVLLDGTCSDPQSYIERFSRSPFLSALPIVTLTAEMTEAANQIPGLAVFPCLASTNDQPIEVNSPEVSALLQVIQMAVGIDWTPQILIFDLPTPDSENSPAPQSVRALMQYLQIAGFQSAIASSWQDVIQSLQHQSVDLLLLCGDPAVVQGQLVEMERSLTPLEAKPQILFWNYQTHRAELDPLAQSTVEHVWGNQTEVIPGSLPMPELLVRVNQVLGR